MAHTQQRQGSAKQNYRQSVVNQMSTPQHINTVLIGSSEVTGQWPQSGTMHSNERPSAIAGARTFLPPDRANDSTSADLNKFKTKLNGSQPQGVKKINGQGGVMSSGPQPSTSTSSAGYN